MIVIGTDTHKKTHTCGAVDGFTAVARGELTAAARKDSFEKLLVWARTLDSEQVWAIEDCRHVSGAFERFLVARSERIVRVAPRRMAGARRSARERGKSDSIDAFSVARAALEDGIENLPGAHLDGTALDIRLLVDHREDLIAARTSDQQRLRWHLHDMWPEFEIPDGALSTRSWLAKVRAASRAPRRALVCGSPVSWCERSRSAQPGSASLSQNSPRSSPATPRGCSPSVAAAC